MLLSGVILMIAAGDLPAQQPRLSEPYEAEYAGEDATGKHVLGLWQFAEGAETADSSGRGHNCELQGATLNAAGRFGACLESFRGWPDEDTRHAAVVPNHPDLSPKGAFTIEWWMSPKADLEGYPDAFLIDKKYVADADYQIILGAADKGNLRRLRANLGFGNGSETYNSEAAVFEAGKWYHVAFVYDGQGGGRFVLNGRGFGGGEVPGRGSIGAGTHALNIGDRVGSYYHGFPGLLDQVRLCQGALEFRRAGIDLATVRRAYVRMEQAPPLKLAVTNFQRSPLSGAQVRVSLSGAGETQFAVPELASGATTEIGYPLNTALRPDAYSLRAAVEIPGADPYTSEQSFGVTIVPRPLPHVMPVLMWGIGSPSEVRKETERLKRIGFTHCVGLGADYARIWDAGAPTEASSPADVASARAMLDEALVNGIGICAQLSPGRWAGEKPELRRVTRDGKPYDKPEVCGLLPEVQSLCRNVGVSVAQTYGDYPAFDAALLHTEVRDGANLCFHEQDRAAFRAATGLEVPEAAQAKWGVSHSKLPNFPADRVIEDNDPIYVYQKWYWQAGDGWNGLNTALAEGLKSTGRKNLWTFHDPAVRVASVLGSGGAVDYLSQWTYSYPDPLRIATATDELLTMARNAGRPQDLMKMTQIIWYRSQTAPVSEASQQKVAAQSVWEDSEPDAAFITIAPMHLREAFWTKIARPIQGIMYHGWQSLVPTGSTSGYRYTHPQTQHELTRLTHEIVQPLGPTLRQVPEAKSDVAFLESFASEMFAGRGTYGWGHTWLGDAYLILQWAQLQPEIVFDETVAQKGLDGYRVLVMMDCDVLTRTVVEKVQAFQKAGGLVVADDRLCPAIRPDIVLIPYERTKQADVDKAALQALAAQLCQQLDKRYQRHVDSLNPNVVTHYRRYGTTDYVFLINDHREFGDYVGRYKLVMERGLPSSATVTIARPAKAVYDLVRHRPVTIRQADGKLQLDADVEPCDGRLLMVTDRAIAGVNIEAPETAKRGDSVTLTLSVVDAEGTPIDAVVPLKLDVLDPDGRPAEFSGYYGAGGGRLQVKLDLAPNDGAGTWEIRATELASGETATGYVRVGE
ncbi:MAG: hypothetical protein FJX75_01155 [Armatimonadetes bacterium]|nr:hypothetical protein [Armatimonadota bacterium]